MGFNLEEKIAAWRRKGKTVVGDSVADPVRSNVGGSGGSEGNGGGSVFGIFGEPSGEGAGESDGNLSRVEFTRTNTAVVDIH